MIKSVTVTNYLGESMMMELANPYKTGLAIANISGLGPAKANIYKTDMSTVDGSVYNSSRTDARNIVMTFVLMEDPSNSFIENVEKIRLKVYKYFPIKKKVTLKFVTDSRSAEIDGYVETCDVSIFSSRQSMQVSIICPDPWFKSSSTDTAVFSDTNAQFSFPFYNLITAEEPNKKELVLSLLETDFYRNIYYSGDDESGMIIEVKFNGPVTGFGIMNIQTLESFKLIDSKIEGGKFIAGDELTISTKRGNRYIRLVRNGRIISVLNALDKESTWLMLRRGDNIYTYSADENANSSPYNMTLYLNSQIIYGGI